MAKKVELTEEKEEKRKKEEEMKKELEAIQKKNSKKEKETKEDDDTQENKEESSEEDENEEVEKDNKEILKDKKNNLTTKRNFAIIFITLLVFVIGLITINTKNNFRRANNIDYSSVITDNETKTSEETVLSNLTDKQKEVLQVHESSKMVEYKNEMKTDLYKKYEQMPEEEKSKMEVIPREEEVPYPAIDTIIEDLKEENQNIEQDVIPSHFNLNDKIDLRVENQQNFGLCWDFASTKSLETYMQLHDLGNKDLSEIHVDYMTSNLMYGLREIHTGGTFNDNYVTYLKLGGPVEQQEYRDYTKEEYEKFDSLKQEVFVTETTSFPALYDTYTEEEKNKIIEAEKKFIMQNGSLYALIASPDFGTTFFNSSSNAEYFNGKTDELTKGREYHAVSIVGWEDNYSRDNFNEDNKPEHDGAWIALNSWGENWGNNGYFYISYEDSIVNTDLNGISSTSLDKLIKLDDIKNKKLKNALIEKSQTNIVEYEGEEYLSSNKLNFLELNDLDITNDDLGIISRLKDLYYLDLSNNNITDLSALSELNQLSVINLSNNKNIKNYSKIPNIESINLSDCNISKLEDISNWTLNDLNVSNNNISEIPNLSNPENLSYLIASKNNIDSFSKLALYTNLYNIDLSYNNISSLEGLNLFSNLSEIDLSGNNITDYSLLIENSNILDNEYISGYYKVTLKDSNISDISIFNNLKTSILDLSNNRLEDISNYQNKNIYEILLGGNKINDYSQISSIEYIDLSNSSISDTSILKPLKNASVLNLSENNISDLSFLKDFDENSMIDLSKNNIKDLSKLDDKIKIGTLILDENKNMNGTIKASIQNISLRNCNLKNDVDLSKIKDAYFINISDNPNFENISSLISKEERYVISDGLVIDKDDIEKIISEDNNTVFENITINYNVDYNSLNKNITITDKSLQKDLRQIRNYSNVTSNCLISIKGNSVKVLDTDKDVIVEVFSGIKNMSIVKLKLNYK